MIMSCLSSPSGCAIMLGSSGKPQGDSNVSPRLNLCVMRGSLKMNEMPAGRTGRGLESWGPGGPYERCIVCSEAFHHSSGSPEVVSRTVGPEAHFSQAFFNFILFFTLASWHNLSSDHLRVLWFTRFLISNRYSYAIPRIFTNVLSSYSVIVYCYLCLSRIGWPSYLTSLGTALKMVKPLEKR